MLVADSPLAPSPKDRLQGFRKISGRNSFEVKSSMPAIEMAGFDSASPGDQNGRFCQAQVPTYRFTFDPRLARNSSLRPS